MTLRVTTALVAAMLFMAPAVSHADLASYGQNFESLAIADPAALSNDGWLVYGNVFDPTHSVYYYGYGPFPAPNPGGGFSAIAAGEGGPAQGAQQLSIYSDYNNADQANGNLIEANVYHEMTIGAADVGSVWVFQFDAKRGNLSGATTALAFIKTLNPAAGWSMTNFLTADMTAIPASWGTYAISITITPALVGQILQFGFANTATHYEGSGIFYDNVSFTNQATAARAATWGSLKSQYR